MKGRCEGPVVSAVITTRNRREMLLRCVASLRMSRWHPDELIVVDDGSSDGTESLTASDLGFSCCEVVRFAQPVMLSRARNEGGKRSRGEFVLFVDDDNEVDENMIERLLGAFTKYGQFGILGTGMLEFEGGERIMDGQRFSLWTGRTRGFCDGSLCDVVESDGAPNVFMARREVLEECDWFDESIVQTFTEPEFALKARLFGWRCGVVKAAVTRHDRRMSCVLSPRSLGAEYCQKAYCLMRNRTVLVARYGSVFQKVVYAVCFSWLWPLLYSMLMVRFRRWDLIGLYWRGFLDGMRYLLGGGRGPVPEPKVDWARVRERCGV